MNYTETFHQLHKKIDGLMQTYIHMKENLDYGYRRRFENNLWFDLIDYKKNEQVFLRFGRGALLVKNHPMLQKHFDDISKVVGKIELNNTQDIDNKNIAMILAKLSSEKRS